MSNDILKKCEISELDRIDKFYRYVMVGKEISESRYHR